LGERRKTMELKDKIKEVGVENCLFIFPFRPIRTVMGLIAYTSSNDEEADLPAVINEERYKIEDGYKITLQCTVPGFGKKHLYQTDLKALIERGIATMYRKEETK